MTIPSCSDEEFITILKRAGTAEASRILNVSDRNIRKRRKNIEQRYGISLSAPYAPTFIAPQALNLNIQNGVVLIGSDAHIWPGPQSTAIRSFIKFCGELKPKAVIMNGDVLDFPKISRHPAIGWQNPPQVYEEIEAAQDILHEIGLKCGRNVRKLWTWGNHDQRLDTRLANSAAEFRGVKGTQLIDHFSNWEHAWSIFINKDIVVKHRYKGGIHAPHSNTMWSGCTIITGHLHSQKIIPFDDYRGTRYGVDTGCLADPQHEAFHYNENNPKNWRSGFAVLTFVNGALLPPELVTVWDTKSVVFRGKILKT